jgi:heme exporter protein B
MNRWRVARLVAAKDLRVEARSRVLLNQILPFTLIVMVLFAFALDADNTVLQRVAPGLVWLAAMFSLLVMVQRTFSVESADGALDALRVAGVSSAGLFVGKSVALAVELLVVHVVLLGLAVVFYGVSLGTGGVSGVLLLVCTALLAAAGLAVVGTMYGGLAAGVRGRETLLPLLLLPVVAPVLIGATRATEAAFGTGGATPAEGWPWLALLGAFATLFSVGGALAFGALIDE